MASAARRKQLGALRGAVGGLGLIHANNSSHVITTNSHRIRTFRLVLHANMSSIEFDGAEKKHEFDGAEKKHGIRPPNLYEQAERSLSFLANGPHGLNFHF